MAHVKTRDRQRTERANRDQPKTTQPEIRSGAPARQIDKSERAWRSRNPDRAIDRGR